MLQLLCGYNVVLFYTINVSYLYSSSTLRGVCTVSNVAVFCSVLMSWFLGTLSRCFLNDLKMVPSVITGSTLSYIPRQLYSSVRSLYFNFFRLLS